MAFYEVPTDARDGVALINPEQVTLLATPDHRPDLRIIYLMTGSRSRSEHKGNEVWTTASLESVLKAFGPFVKVKRCQIAGNPWNDYYVRIASIASVEKLDDGRARVKLIDGYELMIKDAIALHVADIDVISLV